MTVTTSSRPVTLDDSFSFYVPATDAKLIGICSSLADAVVVRGRKGPDVVAGMRSTGWDGTVLFDRGGYEARAVSESPDRWFDLQEWAGADRLLTTGSWVPWDESGGALRRAVETELLVAQATVSASVVLALDSKWLRQGIETSIAVLGAIDKPVVLVLAHRGDPLSVGDAVPGLLALKRCVPGLTILRCDHGAIGAVAFGLVHGSIGLRTLYRHFVPPEVQARGIPHDWTPRLFVWHLMDWFSCSTISAWVQMDVETLCSLECCEGQSLTRFLDPRLVDEAAHHNRIALAHLGNYVLGAPRHDRPLIFSRLCRDAVKRYGAMGKNSMYIPPKAQLVQWAQFA